MKSPKEYNSPRYRVTMKNQVTINGEVRDLAAGTTLLDLVRELRLEPERVAVEMDRAIVKRDLWTNIVVDSGAQIEIVQFVGGG
ncbi:MAG TPA: sulfur carrier protein ThiS [Bryobacteraceae bacterium]|nr:sulfur carrier protein ThiS [Bryobacteraceae bacterium]